MKLRTLWRVLGGTSAPLHLGAMRLIAQTHRVAWLASACKHHVPRLLAEPKSFEQVAAALQAVPARHEGLRAWLTHGCLLGELRLHDGRYTLRSSLARALADPRHEVLAALVEALVAVHHQGIYGALDDLQAGRSLTDLDHELVARVSELTAPVLEEVIDQHVPHEGALRLLELGCGHCRHIRHACARNPALHALGIDLDPTVAEHAAQQLADAGLSDRAHARAGDLRTVTLDERFDRVTLFNLIYYFPVVERPEVLGRAAGWLDDGGVLLLTSMCRGGGVGSNALDVWFSSIRECGPLPWPHEVVAMLEAVGLEVEEPVRLMPGESYHLFVGRKRARGQLVG